MGNKNLYKPCIHGMSKRWDKFTLLMWKNWILQYRKPLQTVIEILAPVLFSILLVIVRNLVEPTHNPTLLFEPFCPTSPLKSDVFSFICDLKENTTSKRYNISGAGNFSTLAILYTPINDDTERIMQLSQFASLDTIGFNTSQELVDYYRTNQTILVGLEFGEMEEGKDINVKIRFPSELRVPQGAIGGPTDWKTNQLYPIYQMRGPRNPNATRGGDPGYANELFLAIQEFLTISMIYMHPNKTTSDVLSNFPYVHVRRFPYYQWEEDPLLQALQGFAGLVVMVSFCYTCTNLVKMITNEKEKQLKEAMKMMGLPNWLHWLAWFLKSFSFLSISVILITILLKVKWYSTSDFSVLTFSNPSIILTFFLLYVCSIITFCFAISVFFSKANTAATVSSVIWFLSYVPYLILRKQYDTLSLGEKLATSLGMNSAMAYGLQIMLMFEGSGEGSQWHNLFKAGSPDDTLTLGLVFVMLVIDTILYLLIALYFEAVIPGEYGLPKPWYFLFTKNFWCDETIIKGPAEDITTPEHLRGFFEKEPTNLHAGIQIRSLRKVFKGNVAVDNLALNMYENQITVLLGHNGAGKTTTMSMLTGMFPPTSGTAIINGFDIRTDMDGVRSSLGLCPQHNILFDELTVREHFYFYSKLKGKREEDIQAEVRKYLSLLELGPKADAKSSTLSGGMKRKLCVGIALCGNSKIVMLDEPTAGMDPSARRALWELIQSEKQGRTMLLTTHFMDEADLLGDRIAIMAGGRLKCCGSSFFLKKKYGAGYNLVMEKSPRCDPEEVKDLLKTYIPNIEIHSNVGSELNFLLPEDAVSVFEDMFRELERSQKELGVNSYGVSLTTLEEVFMKVGADHEGSARPESSENGISNGNHCKVSIGGNHFLTGYKLIKNQYLAMLMKKILSALRSWRLHLIVLAIPVFMIIVTMLLNKAQKQPELPPLSLNLEAYSKQRPTVLVESDGTTDYEGFFKGLSHVGNYRKVDDLTKEMLRLTKDNAPSVRSHYLTGASFQTVEEDAFFFSKKNRSVLTAWFNNDAYHTAPVALGMVLNSIYQKMVNSTSKINFLNHPLPFKLTTQFNKLSDGDSMGFNIAFNLGFSMTFVSSFFILFYIRERMTKSKHLQFVSGVKVFIYWTTSYVCDILTFTVIQIATIITLASFQEDGLKAPDDLARIFLLLFMFSYSVLPLMYAMSFFFEIPSTGYTRLSLFGVLAGDMAFLIIQLLKLPVLDLQPLANTLHWVFLIVPHYSLCTGVLNNYNIFAFNKYCSLYVKSCEIRNTTKACWDEVCSRFSDYCCKEHFQWTPPGLSANILYMFIFGTVIFVVIVMVDYKMFNLILEKLDRRKQKFPLSVPFEDSDVADEKERIRNCSELQLRQNHALVLKDVTRYYGRFLAVNGLCLGIKESECFGLLGINGAGKTTTFMMLTGDVKMTYGKAWVRGLSINSQLKQVQKLIGYCPQFDALLDDLTARESLTMFCLLRGIRKVDCAYIAEKLAKDFDFTKHLDKQVKELSGGNKRKLSTAIALIGDPPVLYLDEPTTGMDPATKRYLWNALCAVRDSGKCIVLTSHSMEECEALCTKIAIMVNGNFKCLGSTQHLKSKFAEGYTLTIKVRKADGSHGLEHAGTESIKSFVEKSFGRVQLREEHQELITYYILDTSMAWSTMFGILERGKKELNIEDYSLGQSSLEQVFLTFTKHQSHESPRHRGRIDDV
ncbi:phospholipid-transporting ATPase ABCA3-like isoform X2 [Harmonia axyridis]|uniref:phospholipid-transporting ATPase ABCA3-like isoform X2 n=1 Tax=Harmonia axyridis TaxID=115357 RepID=UPI001E275A15|nr:phospholipid-transporting ATPase ABCA3-like isoform X2 [Harmonia axyridis]